MSKVRKSAEAQRSRQWYQKRLLRLITSPDAEAAILAMEKANVPKDGAGRLARISAHFNKREPKRNNDKERERRKQQQQHKDRGGRKHEQQQSDDEEGVENRSDPIEISDDSEFSSNASTKWLPILALRAIKEPSFVDQYFLRYPCPPGISRAAAFLSDYETTPNAHGDRLNKTLPAPKDNPSEEYTASLQTLLRQNFQKRFIFTQETRLQNSMEQVRYNYSLIMWYNFVTTLWPEHSGSRIGKRMVQQMEPLLSKMFPESNEAQIQEKGRKIAEWSKQGRKLHEVLIKPFGSASLLVLNDVLTQAFVTSRTTLSESAKHVIVHLKKIGLEKMTQDGPWRELGDEICDNLNGLFTRIAENYKD